MLRLLPFILIPLLILGGLGYLRYTQSKQNVISAQPQASEGLIEVPKTLPQASLEDRLKAVEETINKLVAEVNKLKSPKPSASADSQFSSLDAAVTELKVKVSALEKGGTATQTSSRAPLYIPFGSGGSSSDSSWASVANYQVSLDPQDYSGYTSMQLEVNFRLPNLIGTAYARLYNSTNGTAISNEISTTSGDFVWVTTATFTLPTGNKTYKLQLKSSDAKTIEVQSARLKVNF